MSGVSSCEHEHQTLVESHILLLLQSGGPSLHRSELETVPCGGQVPVASIIGPHISGGLLMEARKFLQHVQFRDSVGLRTSNTGLQFRVQGLGTGGT